MQSILLVSTSQWNNEVLLGDLNINTNNTHTHTLKCFLFKGNKCICLHVSFSVIYFLIIPEFYRRPFVSGSRFKLTDNKATQREDLQRSSKTSEAKLPTLTHVARGRHAHSRAQLTRRHGNGVFPPSLFRWESHFPVNALTFSTERAETDGGKGGKMSDILCKWLNEEVRISPAVGKYVQPG